MRRTAAAMAAGLMLGLGLAEATAGAAGLAGGDRPGGDRRDTVEADAYPWSSIGRLNNGGRSFCTAVLIASDRVLTAAHCVRSRLPGEAWAPPSSVHFLAGYRRGQYLAHSPAVAITVAPARPGEPDRHADFAVVTLARPMPAAVRPLAVEGFERTRWQADRAAGLPYTQAGYSGDRAHILTRTLTCDIVGFLGEGKLFAHTCHAIGGDSGSPILARRGKDYAVIGLHIASSRSGSHGLAIAGHALQTGLHRLTAALPRAPTR